MKSPMDSSSDVKHYAWPSTMNVANFVTVKPSLEAEGDERIKNFKNWKEQMVCLLESQDVLGFVDGTIIEPSENTEKKQWRRTDRLVKGWILGSIGREVLAVVREKQTARDVWLELDNIFKEGEKKEEGESEDFSRYSTLYQAVQRGEWEFAQNFFPDINQLTTTIISPESETALHVAVLVGKANINLVTKLVELTPRDALAATEMYGNTALHYAAIVGNTEAAMALINKNSDLLYTLNDRKLLPVIQAAIGDHKETLEYLISKCDPNAENNNPFQGELGTRLLIETISSGLLDIALDLAQKYPNLALLTMEASGDSALSMSSTMRILFPRTEYFSWWQNFLYHHGNGLSSGRTGIPIKESKSGAAHISTTIAGDIENLNYDDTTTNNYSTSFQIIFGVRQKVKSRIWNVMDHLVPQVKELREKKATRDEALQLVEYLCDILVSFPGNKTTAIFSRSILTAAKYGISEIVEMIIHKNPQVAFYVDDDDKRNIYLIAANNRFENVINLLHNMGDRKIAFVFDAWDNKRNNLMHLCGKLAPPDKLNLVPGATLQMQRELQWFKEMEKLVHPSRRVWKNKDGETPQMLFTKEHKKLKAEGERWMKDTANACTIAAALIATVVFAAAFTVPGGLESATGFPLFSNTPSFTIFAISDAVSLFTSITSLLMFLSILTSRYAEQDFLYVLPKRLTLGLLSLFVSITFMLIAFSAALYLLLHGHTTWFVVLVAAFASLPVTSFVLLQFPLLVDVINSTYGPGIFTKKPGLPLY